MAEGRGVREAQAMRRTIALITSLTALAIAMPASAGGPPPVPDGASCTLVGVQKAYTVRTLLDRGVPLKVSCTGPATVLVGVDLEGQRFSSWKAEHYDEGSPGVVAFAGPRRIEAAGTVTLRARAQRWARVPARRLAPLPMSIGLGIERTDGEIWNDAKSWWRSRLVSRR